MTCERVELEVRGRLEAEGARKNGWCLKNKETCTALSPTSTEQHQHALLKCVPFSHSPAGWSARAIGFDKAAMRSAGPTTLNNARTTPLVSLPNLPVDDSPLSCLTMRPVSMRDWLRSARLISSLCWTAVLAVGHATWLAVECDVLVVRHVTSWILVCLLVTSACLLVPRFVHRPSLDASVLLCARTDLAHLSVDRVLVHAPGCSRAL